MFIFAEVGETLVDLFPGLGEKKVQRTESKRVRKDAL
jgi:hypothetical protein